MLRGDRERRDRFLADLRKPARSLPVISFPKVALKLGEAASQPRLHRGCGSADSRSNLLTRHSVVIRLQKDMLLLCSQEIEARLQPPPRLLQLTVGERVIAVGQIECLWAIV